MCARPFLWGVILGAWRLYKHRKRWDSKQKQISDQLWEVADDTEIELGGKSGVPLRSIVWATLEGKSRQIGHTQKRQAVSHSTDRGVTISSASSTRSTAADSRQHLSKQPSVSARIRNNERSSHNTDSRRSDTELGNRNRCSSKLHRSHTSKMKYSWPYQSGNSLFFSPDQDIVSSSR